jgi:quercetin dioxygenase-like cupin family protein
MNHVIIPNWREKVVFSPEGPQPQPLVVNSKLKSVLVGLEPGQKVPVHPAPTAVYHFLDGSGWMIVNNQRLPVQTGATIVVPKGMLRGIEAETQLSFLGTHSGEN